MPGASTIILAALAYLGLLFLIAFYGDRQAAKGGSLVRNPYVYTLAIAVYCTSWTYYGAVGSAARGGLEFLAIYLGPTVVFIGWWFVLRKILRIRKAYRITSIADFISSRYGKSTRLSMLVTLIAVVGSTPYIALQLKAVATSFNVLAGVRGLNATGSAVEPSGFVADTGFWVAAGMAAFVILFGTRQIDADEHHEGVVAAVAFESVVKLAAFIAVGLFVTFGLYDGFGALFARAADLPSASHLLGFAPESGPRWLTLMLLSMAAAICLPRQFQITMVENVEERHLATASWLFPLYMLAMSLFALPVALAGLAQLPPSADPDFFVLTLPMVSGHETCALVAFIGGLSSATSMVIVAAIALSTMVCNDLVMPALLRIPWLRLTERGDLTGLLLGIRRVSIVVVFLLGFIYYDLAGESGALAAIGLISFAAVAQFLPAMLGGLFWRGATQAGALCGLLIGFVAWAYTLVLPAIARSGWADLAVVTDGPWGAALLRPEALFGLGGWDHLSHAMFWSLGLNVVAYVAVSLFTRADALERLQSGLFVDVFRHAGGGWPGAWARSASVNELYDLTQRFLGRDRAYRAFRDYARRRALPDEMPAEADADLVAFVERLLAGSLGAASAHVVVSSVAKGEMPTLDEVMTLLEQTHQAIAYSQQLEQKSAELEQTAAELKRANARLEELDKLKDDFLSTVSHELRTPLTSIRSFSEILVDNTDLTEERRHRFLAIIASESQRLTRLIDEILDLARLEQGRSEWHIARIDAALTLEQAVAAVGGLVAERGIDLHTDIQGAGSPAAVVEADPDRLVQVGVNLLSNAVKYARGTPPRVWISGRPDPDGYRVTVQDSGPGIPSSDRRRIFDKFAKAVETAADHPPGTGLGLAISRHIVEHTGGRIWLGRDDEAPGATFHVLLPRAGAPESAAHPETATSETPAARAAE
jgi:Na+/proline symporter/nitrogen-specific signal transduction histidine kinase